MGLEFYKGSYICKSHDWKRFHFNAKNIHYIGNILYSPNLNFARTLFSLLEMTYYSKYLTIHNSLWIEFPWVLKEHSFWKDIRVVPRASYYWNGGRRLWVVTCNSQLENQLEHQDSHDGWICFHCISLLRFIHILDLPSSLVCPCFRQLSWMGLLQVPKSFLIAQLLLLHGNHFEYLSSFKL